MKYSLIPLCVLLLSGSVYAESSTYLLPITRDGKQQTRLASSFWSGEYPSPIIDVFSQKKGMTTVKAFKSLRELKEPVNCTIQNGLYHPWSKDKASAINFYSIVALEEYASLKQQSLDGTDLKKGEVITQVVYHAEGNCGGKLAKTQKEIEFFCDDLLNKQNFKALRKKDSFSEQWIKLKCTEKYEAFIQDSALLGHKGVVEGEIVGYGEIKAKSTSSATKK